MDKYLITGFSGFVSKHFIEYLDSLKTHISIVGVDINQPEYDYSHYKNIHCVFYKIDLLDKGQVDNIIYQFQPHYVLHLASYSSVAYSWKNPVASFSNNTNIFLNLLEQIRALNFTCRVLSIGSSEEYGNVNEKDIPLTEEHALNPVSPYAVARVSQEMLSRIYVDGYGLDIVITRSFNHIGPGQREIFVVSSFARQLVEIKKNNKTPILTTGTLSIVRDFLDVRDVVKAYHTLFREGKKGEVYNVCSGKGITLYEIVSMMAEILDIKVETRTNSALIRPSDNRVILGSNNKITQQTSWRMSYDLEQSLEDIIDYWYNLV